MINVERVQNGYIVVTDAEIEEVDGESTYVAETIEEVAKIMREYFEGEES